MKYNIILRNGRYALLEMEYFDEVCEMTDSEKEFFGIETESEDE